jgi:hypothetical protein
VAAHGDDPVGAELAGGQHGQQPDGAITDHGDGPAWTGLGGHGAEPAGAEHVGGREETRDEIVRGDVRSGDERAVGERDASQLCLRADGAHEHPLDTRALVAGLAELAGAVGGPERADHELAGRDRVDLAADLLDDADVLVAHRGRPVDRFDPAVGPQVRAAHAGRGQPDDRVSRLQDPGVLAVFHPDVAGGVQDSSTHEVLRSLDEVRALGPRYRPQRPVTGMVAAADQSSGSMVIRARSVGLRNAGSLITVLVLAATSRERDRREKRQDERVASRARPPGGGGVGCAHDGPLVVVQRAV